VVTRSSVQDAGVNIGTCGASKSFKEISDQFHLQFSHVRCSHFGIDNSDRAATEIDGCEP
jgi:hypothetical protein